MEAIYTAEAPKKYSLNNRSYDRSGRLEGEELFCIEPDRGIDPLQDYYNRSTIFLGGGLFSDQDPASHPYTAELELNEWQSLPPGSYRLSIIGNRVHPQKRGDIEDLNGRLLPLRSNSVEFQVIKADPNWQAKELDAAKRTLDSPKSTKEQNRHAARVLRFLGSEAAAGELARRYSSANEEISFELMLGLWSTAYRQTAIREMKAALHSPSHPLPEHFVYTIAELEMQADPKPESTKDIDRYWKEIQRRAKGYMSQAGAPSK